MQKFNQSIQTKTTDPTAKKKKLQQVIKDLEIEDNVLLNANPGIKRQVLRLVENYLGVFSDEQNQYGHRSKIEFQVKLKEGARAVKTQVRPLNSDQKASLKKQLDSWQREGVIEPSTSLWAAPLVPVKKKDGGTRLAVNYRGLNQVTKADSYPVPLVSESLQRLQGNHVFSSFDATLAYNCIVVAEEARPLLLAFDRKMPFGARNAGATYCWFISELIEEMKSEYVQVYLDDVLEATPDLGFCSYPDFGPEAEPFQVSTDWLATNRAALLSQVSTRTGAPDSCTG